MIKKRVVSLLLQLLLLVPLQLQAAMRPVPKVKAGIPPAEIVEEIVRHNHRGEQNPAVSPAPHTPYITWLADSDSRVQADLLIARPQGKVQVVRNLGNQLALNPGDVDYGVEVLHTPVLLITGNTGSQALHLFLDGYGEAPAALRRELDHLHLPLAACGPPVAEETEPQRLRRAAECNLDYQVEQCLARYADRVADGRLLVAGGIFDLDNQYGRGRDRLLLINLNGIKDKEALKRSPFAVRLDQELAEAALGRTPVLLTKEGPDPDR